jgi:prephenate dehydrogenase
MSESDFLFERVTIIGTGLIGGSMGMDLRARGLAGEVVGVGRRQVSIDRALEAGACDRVTLDTEDGVSGADLVVLATPISALPKVLPPVVEAADTGCLLTDVASSKQNVIEQARSMLGDRDDLYYLSTHPMAGSEKTGPTAAREGLFEDCVCIFTPSPTTPEEHVQRLQQLWEALGAEVVDMAPDRHDRLVARISHVPHLVAAALIEGADREDLWFAGGGLMDTTRVASSDPGLWCDIYDSNRNEVCRALDEHISLMRRMREMVEDGDFEKLGELLDRARRKRDELMNEREEFNRKRKEAR